jgi:hypothetical protein
MMVPDEAPRIPALFCAQGSVCDSYFLSDGHVLQGEYWLVEVLEPHQESTAAQLAFAVKDIEQRGFRKPKV